MKGIEFNIKTVGPWKMVAEVLAASPKLASLLPGEISKKQAEIAKNLMIQAIQTEGASNKRKWQPLSPWTYLEKGHQQILKDTRLLMNSIKVTRRQYQWWVAEVDPSAIYADGKSVAMIARVHEEGAKIAIRLTEKMAAYLALRAQELGIPEGAGKGYKVGDIMIITIPRRSFIMDTFTAYLKKEERLSLLGAYLGMTFPAKKEMSFLQLTAFLKRLYKGKF